MPPQEAIHGGHASRLSFGIGGEYQRKVHTGPFLVEEKQIREIPTVQGMSGYTWLKIGIQKFAKRLCHLRYRVQLEVPSRFTRGLDESAVSLAPKCEKEHRFEGSSFEGIDRVQYGIGNSPRFVSMVDRFETQQ